VLAFVIHVFVSHTLAHQDCGLGMSADPFVTLPNGYVLGSGNTYDGYIKAPGYKTDVPIAGPGYVRSIMDLELKDGIFTGTQFNFSTSKVQPFSFDTHTRRYKIVQPVDTGGPVLLTEDQKTDAWGAAMTSVHDDANSYWRMYEQNRHKWPEIVFAILLFGGEFLILLWLRSIWRSSLSIEDRQHA
jgi:hypothetical protein